MPLTPGQTLSSYEILALLGKGGMGEVYRARDTNLDREVAIKVLPDELTHDEERVLRFQREAKVLASLAHPNIGAIHGFESVDSTRFLVLEYVEGETLKARLERGPLAVEEAIETCRQIAEAVEAAHENGVVHRDLKPGNVQLRADGTVKVLDFGLARAVSEEGSESAVSDSPTITADFTRPGVVLGTAAYMSPEQARGKAIDKRSDNWAFGCCLYESLSGVQAFRGQAVSDVFAEILKGEPDWAKLPKQTPWKLRELMERCLTKDPSMRLRDIGDARIELRKLSTDTGSLTAAAEVTAAPVKGRPVSKLAFGLALMILGAVLALAIRSALDRPEVRPLRQLAIDLPDSVPTEFLLQPKLSADGRRLVFQTAAERQFASRSWFLHDLSTRSTRPLSSLPPLVDYLFSTPDGSTIGFLESGTLKVVSADGGPVQDLLAIPVSYDLFGQGLHGVDWGEDGMIAFVAGEPRVLYTVRPGDAEPKELYTAESSAVGMGAPRILPGGKAVLVDLGRLFGGGSQAVGLVELETGTLTRLIEGASTATFVRTGHLLYAQDGALMASRFDPNTFELGSESIAVPVDRILVDPFGAAHYSVSRDEGSLVFRPGSSVDLHDVIGGTQIMWSAEEGSLVDEPLMGLDFDISRDGRLLAVSTFVSEDAVTRPLPPSEIRLFDLNNPSAPSSRLARGVFQYGLHFSPDGSHLAYSANDENTLSGWEFFVIPVGERVLDPEPVQSGYATGWTPDSKSVLFTNSTIPGAPPDVFRIALGETDPEPVLSSPSWEGDGTLSPDGAWLAFRGDLDGQAPGKTDLYVQRYPPQGRATRITTGGVYRPKWDPRKDELRLYFVVGGDPEANGAGGALHVATISDTDGQVSWEIEELLAEVPTMRLERFTEDGRIMIMETFNNMSGLDAGDRFIHVANFLDWLETTFPPR